MSWTLGNFVKGVLFLGLLFVWGKLSGDMDEEFAQTLFYVLLLLGAVLYTQRDRDDPSVGRFRAIRDKYKTLPQVQSGFREAGLESCNLIVGVDFTKSNEWSGKKTFHRPSMHTISQDGPTPYEEVLSIVCKTLETFDDDKLIPAYGFGDVTTQIHSVFSFLQGDAPCQGLEAVRRRYRAVAGKVELSGPTNFGPLIRKAVEKVVAANMTYHILVIVADGQVTQEQDTRDAIYFASDYPLSIVMVGVGDGPWDMMQEFDDKLPRRRFDNFQFVDFNRTVRGLSGEAKEAAFAVAALMECPEQYKLICQMGLLGRTGAYTTRPVRTLPPPDASSAAAAASAVGGTAASAGGAARTASAAAGGSSSSSSSSSSAAAGGGGGATAPLSRAQRPSAPPAPLSPDHHSPLIQPSQNPSDYSEFVCPITQEVYEDPVVCMDGHSYERTAIEEWLRRHDTSPLTNQRLPGKLLVPNHAIRSRIQAMQGLRSNT